MPEDVVPMTGDEFSKFLSGLLESELRNYLLLYYPDVETQVSAGNSTLVQNLLMWLRDRGRQVVADQPIHQTDYEIIKKKYGHHPRFKTIGSESLTYEEYRSCFRKALYRLIATANIGKSSGFLTYEQLRSHSDDQIAHFFEANDSARNLIRWATFSHDEHAGEQEIANEYFYGNFYFTEENIGKFQNQKTKFVKVRHDSTEAFVRWSHEKFFAPKFSDDRTGKNRFASEKDYLKSCAVNYLLKNFWHNYVHNVMQGISHKNYSDFGGDARYYSDFEADNLASIFLARSYGFQILTDCVEAGSNNSRNEIEQLFARNLCNEVFADRARKRNENMDSVQKAFADLEWRARRKIANMLSQRLIAEGLAVGDLTIIFSGSVKQENGKPNGRDGNVIAVLNGFYLNSGHEPLLKTSELSDFVNNETQNRQSKEIDERNRSIVDRLVNDYRNRLRNEPHAVEAAAASLNHAYTRAWFKL